MSSLHAYKHIPLFVYAKIKNYRNNTPENQKIIQKTTRQDELFQWPLDPHTPK